MKCTKPARISDCYIELSPSQYCQSSSGCSYEATKTAEGKKEFTVYSEAVLGPSVSGVSATTSSSRSSQVVDKGTMEPETMYCHTIEATEVLDDDSYDSIVCGSAQNFVTERGATSCSKLPKCTDPKYLICGGTWLGLELGSLMTSLFVALALY